MVTCPPMESSFLKSPSLIFAPLEGITDSIFRQVLAENFPEWDYYSTDFFRSSREAPKNDRLIRQHLGSHLLKHPKLLQKTIFQILTSPQDQYETIAQQAQDLGINWLDLNAGCPAKRVVFHKGGSYLLSSPKELQVIVSRLRKKFLKFLSVKIRIGLSDDQYFFEILKILQGEGVDAITLHGRLQTQFYLGQADWNYIAQAVQHLKIPLIGNGDIWTLLDAEKMLKETQCHSLMIGRGAIKAPWFAKLIREKKELTLYEHKNEIRAYLNQVYQACLNGQMDKEGALRRIKSLCALIFTEFQNGLEIRTKVMRSSNFEQIKEAVEELVLQKFGEKNK